ncbi:MAG: glycosyltransferase family 2 protein [Desulfuromonadaceae bacterium]
MKKNVLPRVTVLMPVYNGELYLEGAIRSILMQTFTDFEFLIIDDGSVDESVAVIQGFRDSRIRLVSNGTNLGVVASLNKGLELAQTEFIARMDADDISRPERLARQVSFMDDNPLVGVCGSWVKYLSKADKSIWKLPKGSENIRCWQFHTVGVAHPSVMLRRQFFTEYGLLYDHHYRHIEDFELWGRAIRYMSFDNIQKVLLDYRISPEQICATHGAEQLAAVAPLRLQRVRELEIEPTLEEQLLHEMIMNIAIPAESVYLDRAELWLMQLDSANRAVGTYPADCFTQRLLDIWFSNCMTLADASACSLRRCLMSPLWTAVRVPAWHRARALGAWITRKVV